MLDVELPSAWRWETLGSVADPNGKAIVSGPFGSNIGSRFFVETGIPVIRGNNLTTDMRRFVDDGFVFVTQEKADELRNCGAVQDDLVFTAAGSLGQVGIIPAQSRFPRYIISNKQMRARVDKRFVDPLFAFYWFSSPPMVEYVRQRNTGSSVPLINLGVLRSLPFPLAPLSEQRAIASVLGSLDDKIELNRRMNEKLEALAQSLFKSWFVDTTEVALPKGWRAGTLGEVAENPRRGIQPDEIKTDTAYIGLEHMPRRCIALSDWGHTEELASGKFEFNCGEILFGKLRPYFHKVGVAPLDGVCSTDILVVTPKESLWFGFVLGHVSSVELVNYTNAASTGTKMPRANWNDISRYEVALPPKQLAADFTEQIHPLVERIIANIHESRTLAALRDALLPKLLSGELRMPVDVIAK